MRPSARFGLLIVSLCVVSLTACNPAPTATASATKTSSATLASLSPEQQSAVRALIRETLVSNPEILTEAALELNAREKTKAMSGIMAEAADIYIGNKNAPITVVEYFDYRCGYCHAANDYVFNLAKTRKDIKIVFKDLPILSAESEEAARASIAIHMQDRTKYAPFHRALMQFKGELNMSVVERIAKETGVDVARMKADMNKQSVTDHITQVRQQAQALGINGTPGFVINGTQVSGFDVKALDAAIAAAGVKGRA